MALIEEFDKSGNWLFKHRSFIPIVLYVFAVLVIAFVDYEVVSHTNIIWSMACLAISFLGLLVRIITIAHAPKGTSGRNTTQGQVAEKLNTDGIYSAVRHPLYLGNFLMWFGLFLYVSNIWFVIVSSLLYWLYYERIMFAEEFFLRKKFGEAYLKWSETVPSFWPKFSIWKKSELPFSTKNVLKREYSGFFATIFSFSFIDFAKHYFYNGEFTLSLHWMIILPIGFVVFIVFRSLKKYTKVLEVKGR
ncbi:MAG: isoprenylcysteine carboxylmethyltransferase family protein [Saprospiraceae bacterium]|nr:isoprenylcysteine carboxylmethyltransferase family protein [Saprospiraceae bacterium]